MIKKEKWNQFGFPREKADIQGITIHETGKVWEAKALHDWMDNESKTSQGCHYICDANETVQTMPDEYSVYHTGKGIDWACRHTIAIEICSSLSDEKYESAVNRAISLVYSLQKKYKIPMESIFFHNDFNSKTYCPKTLLDRYGNSKAFAYERLGE